MDGGGALVGLDFDATVAWPYPTTGWGWRKAALESVNRYPPRTWDRRGSAPT